MVINKENLISEIKNAFTENFPGLKIEFFKHSHSVNQMSKKEDWIDGDVKLSSLNSDLKSDELKFDPKITAFEFEDHLNKAFGLNVQVYRRSNNIWLQTSSTDHWTLSEQNRKGLNSQK